LFASSFHIAHTSVLPRTVRNIAYISGARRSRLSYPPQDLYTSAQKLTQKIGICLLREEEHGAIGPTGYTFVSLIAGVLWERERE
jgi:hypothetical protein